VDLLDGRAIARAMQRKIASVLSEPEPAISPDALIPAGSLYDRSGQCDIHHRSAIVLPQECVKPLPVPFLHAEPATSPAPLKPTAE
jgi:hypothetical protein